MQALLYLTQNLSKRIENNINEYTKHNQCKYKNIIKKNHTIQH
jgi:hypothetical protein